MKVKLNVPDSLSEITLGQYQRFEKLNTVDNQDTSFLLQKMVEIFCGIDLKDIATIKFSDVQGIAATLNDLFQTSTPLIKKFTLQGKLLGFVPNLDDLTLGEYIDLDTNITDWQTMHKAMAVLFREVTFEQRHQYQIQKYEGITNSEAYKDMPLDVALGAQSFFLSLGNELLTHTLNYLELDSTNPQLQETLLQNGDGIKASMEFLKGILPSLMRLQN